MGRRCIRVTQRPGQRPLDMGREKVKKFHIPNRNDVDQFELPCHWHEFPHHTTDKISEWYFDAPRAPENCHACHCCENYPSLCSVLESRSMIVLLPLHSSARENKRPSLGPNDHSYWINSASIPQTWRASMDFGVRGNVLEAKNI